MKKIIIPAVVLFAGCVVYFTATHSTTTKTNNSIPLSATVPVRNAPGTRHPAEFRPRFSAVNVPAQMKQQYKVSASASQVITGNCGTMIFIPDHAFADKNGNAVKGKVKLELVEGIADADIMKMNLGTMSDQGILQTAGMISISAFAENGDSLQLAAGRQLDVEIPAAHHRNGMMLWDGKTNADGSITWTNPQQLNNGLREVPLETLADSSQSGAKKEKRSDHIATKIHASWGFSYWSGNGSGIITGASLMRAYKVVNRPGANAADTVFRWKTGMPGGDSVAAVLNRYERNGFFEDDEATFFSDSGNVVLASNGYDRNGNKTTLDLTDKKFLHTNIATAEFRSRLPFIRQCCDAGVIDCYTSFPTRELWKSDLAAADLLKKSGCALESFFRALGNKKQDNIDPKDPKTAAALDAARTEAIRSYSKKVHALEAAEESYSFGMKKLGWANVDCLYHNSTAGAAPFFLNAHVDGVNEDEDPQVTLMVPSQGIHIPGYRRPNGDYSFTHGEYEQSAYYPKGEKGYILVRSGAGDKLRYALKEIVFGENAVESLTMKAGTEDELAKALGNAPPQKKAEDESLVDDWYTRALNSGGGCLCDYGVEK
ncbi:MAG TPA: hypothetical protein VFU15_12690 [Bacteroidia bacterium]|nr:hypothetical protein [Bacteroidia bacterium]